MPDIFFLVEERSNGAREAGRPVQADRTNIILISPYNISAYFIMLIFCYFIELNNSASKYHNNTICLFGKAACHSSILVNISQYISHQHCYCLSIETVFLIVGGSLAYFIITRQHSVKTKNINFLKLSMWYPLNGGY